MFGANILLMAISEIYKVSVNIDLLSGGQITQPMTVIVGKMRQEENISV
jgi:hypothetical protein